MNKVFGIGLDKTGTTTLGKCLEILGYNHMSNSLELLKLLREDKMGKIWECVDNHDSFEDVPWFLLYKELDKKYPDSKFILTERITPEKWLRSVSYQSISGLTKERRVLALKYNRLTYGLDYVTGHEEKFLGFYNKHGKDVREYFKDRPDDLLIICWGKGDGWNRICNFLDVPIPDRPIPEANVSNWYLFERRRRMAKKYPEKYYPEYPDDYPDYDGSDWK